MTLYRCSYAYLPLDHFAAYLCLFERKKRNTMFELLMVISSNYSLERNKIPQNFGQNFPDLGGGFTIKLGKIDIFVDDESQCWGLS